MRFAGRTRLTPARHRLNLTIRGNVFVRRVIIERIERGRPHPALLSPPARPEPRPPEGEGTFRVAGVEAESGGEIFTLACDRVVLCAGTLKSPHILMLSGVGPRDQLEDHSIPVLVESPGVGQNLFNHPMGSVTFQVNEGVKLTAQHLYRSGEALRFGLRVTSEPPSHPPHLYGRG